jgi:hypothetical protein
MHSRLVLAVCLTTCTVSIPLAAEPPSLCGEASLAVCLGLPAASDALVAPDASDALAAPGVNRRMEAFAEFQIDRLIDSILALRESGLASTAGQDVPGYKDFLTQFGVSTGLFTTGEDDTSFTLTWNVKGLQGKRFQPQLETRLVTAPTLFDALAETIPEDGREDAIARLEKGLDGRDDVTHTLHIKLNRPARKTDAVTEAVADSATDRLALGATPSRSPRTPRYGMTRALAQDLAPLGRAAVATQFRSAARNLSARQPSPEETEAAFAAALRDPVVARLNTNDGSREAGKESQFYFSLSYRDRSELTGPGEISAKLTYETAPFDDNDGRFAFSGSYVETRRYAVSLENAALELPSRDKGVFQLTYNRSFVQPLLGSLGSLGWKLEAAAKGETSSDSGQKDRWIATLTLTQPLGTGASLAAGLVWANREEFLPDDTDRVSARVGLRLTRLGPST